MISQELDNYVFERPSSNSHVVILHEKMYRRKTDKYAITIGLAFQKLGYKVTIITSRIKANQCVLNDFPDKLNLVYSGWWIPKSILGLFKTNMSAFKAAWMALRLILCPPKPHPEIIVLNVSVVALIFLKWFTKYKVFYIERFLDFGTKDACYEHSRITPSYIRAKGISLADQVIVESHGFAEILIKSLNKEPRVLYPAVDVDGLNESGPMLARLIPDLVEDSIIFLTAGSFCRSSNFTLALEAFDILLSSVENRAVTERFVLIFAGSCNNLEERYWYHEIVEMAKNRKCAGQVYFLQQVPAMYEKSLITDSNIIIHPAKNDVSSDFLLKAMCLGKPIVATNKGIATKLLTHRVSGVLIEPEARIFAVALKKLMMSPHLQVFLGDMARESFERFYSFEGLCENVKDMLKKPVPKALPDVPDE